MKLRYFFTFNFIFLISICFGQDKLDDTIPIKIHEAILDFKTKIEAPSIVIAIVHDDNIIFEEALGYADIKRKIPATIDTKYPIMSVTKTFTATMYMRLYEQGFVGLDDDIRKYIPEYNVISNLPDHQKTTLLQLATHTSGLPRNSPVDIKFFSNSDRWFLNGGMETELFFPSNSEFIKSLCSVKLEFNPYEYMYPNDRHYSNMGYSLLGIAMERASGIDFTKYVTDSICIPLGMRNTGFLTNDYLTTDFAKGYIFHKNKEESIQTPYLHMDSSIAIYPGGMYSTVRDMAKYISFQLQEDKDEPNKVLSSYSKAMMQKLNISWRPSYPYTLHEGSILGYRCNLILVPNLKLGWIVLTNTSDVSFSMIDKALRKILFPLFEEQVKPTPELFKYAGKYKLLGGYDKIELTFKNDSLYSDYLDDLIPNNVLIPIDRNNFKVEGDNDYDIYYKFNFDKEMNVTSLNLGPFIWYREK